MKIFKWNFLLNFFLSFIVLGCSAQKIVTQNESNWFYPKTTAKSVIIMIHGLNARPYSMYPMAEFLAQNGHIVRVIALPGHDGVDVKNCNITSLQLEKLVQEELQQIQKIAHEQKIPANGIGFSLGGLMLANTKVAPFLHKTVLIAPALYPKWYVNLMRVTKILPNCWAFPSKNREDIKANSKTTAALYHSLFNLMDQFNPKSLNDFIIMADPFDSLINYQTTVEKLPKARKIITVSSQHKDHHLIIDPTSLGIEQWNQVTQEILLYINEIQ